MKRIQGILCGFLAAVILLLCFPAFAETVFQFRKSENVLYFDGAKINTEMYNYAYTNYAPIRIIAEAYGLDIKIVGTDIFLTTKSEDIKMPEEVLKETDYVTKAELARWLVQSLEPQYIDTSILIHDVSEANEYYDDILKAVSNEYLARSQGKFYPDDFVTRIQFAGYLCKSLNRVDDTISSSIEIKDLYIAQESLRPYIETAIALGLMELYEDGTFRPYEPLVMDLTPDKDLQNYVLKDTQ